MGALMGPTIAAAAVSALVYYAPRAVSIPVLLLFAGYIYNWPLREWCLAFYNLPGPSSNGTVLDFLFGKMIAMFDGVPGGWHLDMVRKYGLTFRTRFVVGQHIIHTIDPVAVSYLYRNVDKFERPPHSRNFLLAMVGDGLLTAEGAEHTRQRRILQHAFSTKALHGMVPVFFDKAEELADKMDRLVNDHAQSQAAKQGDAAAPNGHTTNGSAPLAPSTRPSRPHGVVNLLQVLQEFTLDVIGKVGFGYDFNSLKMGQDANALAKSFSDMVDGLQVDPFFMLQLFIPGLDKVPIKTKGYRKCKECEDIARPLGMSIIERKKAEVEAISADGKLEGVDVGTDLLSHLIRANMADDVRASQRLTDEEVLAQVTTFMFAGNETAATALSWTLYQLCLQPDIQKRLREELLAVPTDRPEPEDLLAIPYLDAVVRESLRFHSPVAGTWRTPVDDIVIPLGVPVKGRNGKTMDSLPLKKGDDIWISAIALNLLPEMWGPDAGKFNPDRWIGLAGGNDMDDGSEHANGKVLGDGAGVTKWKVTGTWSNVLSFLGGPRICIGMRLALLEIKVALFVLLRRFEFGLDPNVKIKAVTSVVIRPSVEGEGMKLPLIVTPLEPVL